MQTTLSYAEIITKILEWKNMDNVTELSRVLEYKSPEKLLRLIRDEKNKPSTDLLLDIAKRFPQINPAWLLTGSGPMLIEGNTANAAIANPHDVTVAPLISQYAYAGYLSGFSDHDYLDAQPHYVAARRHNGGHYVAFEVRGDSMDDNTKRSICEGDILLGRELKKDLWRFRLHIPKVFVIVHKTDGIICKEIIAHDVENGIITCHSWNPDPEYQDFKVDMREILQLFYVKEISRQNKY